MKFSLVQNYFQICFATFFLALVSTANCYAATSELLEWDAPTTNTDQSPLIDLAGYRVKRSIISGNYSEAVVSPVAASSTSFLLENLPSGTFYFIVTAMDQSGNESDPSNEISIQVNPDGSIEPDGPNDPNDPNNFADDNHNSADDDGDGVLDASDNCPMISNANQSDRNHNGIGDACEDSGRSPLDIDGDGSTDLFLSNGKSYLVYGDILKQSSVSSFTGTLGKGTYGSGDINGDGKSEVLAAASTSKGLRWQSINVDGKNKRDLKYFSAKSDLAVIGCNAKNKVIQAAVRPKSGGGGQFLLKGKKAVSLKNRQTGLFCSRATDSRLIGIEKSGSKYYSVITSLAGKLASRVQIPSGVSSVQLVAVPKFGSRKEQIMLIGKSGSSSVIYKLNESKKRFEKFTLNVKVGAPSGVMAGVIRKRYGFVGIASGASFKIIPIEGVLRGKVVDLPYLSIPRGMKIVK